MTQLNMIRFQRFQRFLAENELQKGFYYTRSSLFALNGAYMAEDSCGMLLLIMT